MTQSKLNKLITMLREQKIYYFKGTYCGEEVELKLSEETEQEPFEEMVPQPPKSREDVLRDFERDLF